MKNKRVALYNPYLDTLGGGERHVLSILQVLQECGYAIDIWWDTDMTNEFSTHLGLTFSKQVTIKSGWQKLSPWERLKETSQYDIFLYISDGSFIFSWAKHTFIFCMVPQKKLYQMNTLNRLKTLNSTFISNSLFTRTLLSKWGVHSSVLYPYIDQRLIETAPHKENIILNVGRFFEALHTKRQDVCIDWFIKFKDTHPSFADLTLILVGGESQKNNTYVATLRAKIANRSDITIKTNVSHEELLSLYSRARIMWHFAGFEVDEYKHPENTEHLGITPIEAMATETIVMAYANGGPKEIIKDGSNGYLFLNQEKLFSDTERILNSESMRKIIVQNGKKYVHELFSYTMFENEVKRIITSKCI